MMSWVIRSPSCSDLRISRFNPSAPSGQFFNLFDEAGTNILHSGQLLVRLMKQWPDAGGLGREILICEQEGDRITHDIIHRLGSGKVRAPFDFADGYALATALDDVVDYAEQTADTLGVYHVEAPMEQADRMCDVLVGAGEQVANALRGLRTGSDLGPALVEIHRLENEGDRLSREAMASLFANGIDPMVVIRWKDIFASLEASIDACEHVAHVLEGIALKRRR
jgi:predicted phosphate transport protein (TIGR00153 family)